MPARTLNTNVVTLPAFPLRFTVTRFDTTPMVPTQPPAAVTTACTCCSPFALCRYQTATPPTIAPFFPYPPPSALARRPPIASIVAHAPWRPAHFTGREGSRGYSPFSYSQTCLFPYGSHQPHSATVAAERALLPVPLLPYSRAMFLWYYIPFSLRTWITQLTTHPYPVRTR